MREHYQHLCQKERSVIYHMMQEGKTQTEIANCLGRHLRRDTEHNIVSLLGADLTDPQHAESSASTTQPILVVHLQCIYSLNQKETENKGGSSAIKELTLIRPWSCGTDDHFCRADEKLIIQCMYVTKIAFVHTAVRNATTSG